MITKCTLVLVRSRYIDLLGMLKLSILMVDLKFCELIPKIIDLEINNGCLMRFQSSLGRCRSILLPSVAVCKDHTKWIKTYLVNRNTLRALFLATRPFYQKQFKQTLTLHSFQYDRNPLFLIGFMRQPDASL